MHTDEAVHAFKLGMLMESGRYVYDPVEYHGPTLNGFTLLLAALRGQATYLDLDEVTLRLVPALFGIGMVLLPLLMAGGIGFRAALMAGVITATSPALVFYGRYYIQEVLLVFFTAMFLGCLWRYLQRPRLLWMILAGMAAGFMHASKETCIISFGCMGLAGLIVLWLERPPRVAGMRGVHILALVMAGLVTSAVLFSWFFTHPRGILDSILTYAVYLDRAGHGSAHFHPWYFYLDLLVWVEGFEWPAWNEDYIVVAGLLTALYVLCRRAMSGVHLLWVRFLALYTLLLVVVYSALPYKTPWSMLSFHHGLILLAAVGTEQFLASLRPGRQRQVMLAVVLVFGLLSPLGQAIALNFHYDADQTNPYVYAHTHRDILPAVDAIREVAAVDDEALVHVICPGHDYWPLPWYLRDLTRVGYWNQLDPRQPIGDVIVTQPAAEDAILNWLYEKPPPGQKELFVPILYPGTWLRYGVELRAFTRMSRFERLAAYDENLPENQSKD
jgi:uncharacterized protein (TIGR03663 family)